MRLILDQPAIRARVHRVSVEHYHRMVQMGMLDENHELLRGYVVQKIPKSPLHVRILQKLLLHLIRTVPAGLLVRPEQPLSIGDSEPEPDLSIVRGTADDWAEAHPATAELVIEISVSTLEVDQEKAEIYAEAAVPEYWIVRPEQGEVDVYQKPQSGRYMEKKTFVARDILKCSSVAEIEVSLSDLFAVQRG